ncbi:hypothetical protein AB9K41_13740 [Cribrihabitans sp. XS_ASV171]
MIEFLALTFRSLLAIFAALGLIGIAVGTGIAMSEGRIEEVALGILAIIALIMIVGLAAVLVRIMDLLEEIRDSRSK